MPIKCVFSLVLALGASALAQDALELAHWAPKESYLILTWQGADAAGPVFKKTQLGQLWAEPDVQQFVNAPLAGVKKLLAREMSKQGVSEVGDLVQDTQLRLWNRPGVICVFPVKPDGTGPNDWQYVEALAIAWDMGPGAGALFEKVRDEGEKKDPDATEENVEGVTFLRSPGELPVFFGCQGDRWLIALGRDAAAQIARQPKTSTSFADNPSHQQAAGHFKGIDTILYLNVQVASARERLVGAAQRYAQTQKGWSSPRGEDAAAFAAILSLSLLGGIGSQETVGVIGFEGQYLRRASYVKADPEYPLPSDFVCNRPIDPAKLRAIPANVLWSTMFTWEPSAMYQQTLRTTEKLIPRIWPATQPSAEEARHGKQQDGVEPAPKVAATSPSDNSPGWLERYILNTIGFDINDEILRNLGPHIAYFETREFASGGINLLIEVRDEAALRNQIDTWLKLAPGVRFKEKKVGDRTLKTLDLSAAGVQFAAFALSPCWALSDHWLFISTSTASGSRWLALLNAPDSPSLATREDIKDFLAEHPSPAVSSLTWSDEAATFQPVYAQVATFYPIVTAAITAGLRGDFNKSASKKADSNSHDAASSQPAIEFAPLPDPEVLTRHMLTTISYSTVDGRLRINQTREGAPVLTSATTLVGGSAIGLSALLPSLARARELSKRTVCTSNLKEIGKSLDAYATQQNGKFPASLEALVKSEAMTEKTLICPSSDDEPGGNSYIYILAQKRDPQDVVAYEKKDNHAGEGSNVLFADGRVEFIKPYEKVEQLVSETKERLSKHEAPAGKKPARAKRPASRRSAKTR